MFCNQCEQTARGEGCYQWGACGKNPEVDALQDLMVYALRGLAEVIQAARPLGFDTREADIFLSETLFSTLTNVNFDPDNFVAYIERTVSLRNTLRAKVEAIGGQVLGSAALDFVPATNRDALVQQGKDAEYEFISQSGRDVDVFSLKLTVIYGLKGIAAYVYHAAKLQPT
jgi:hydroxylamine reductase